MMLDFDFRDCERPAMARGDFMWRGVAVVLSPNVPRAHVGDEIVPIMPHHFIAWLWGLFRWPVYPICYVRGAKIEREQFMMAAGKLFCTPAGWEQLCATAKARSSAEGER